MFNHLTQFFTGLSKKYLPDAFVFAILLSFVVLILGVIAEGHSNIQMIRFWGDGFWNLLTFSMQMALILIMGFTLAKTELVGLALKKLANLANSQTSGVLIVLTISLLSCYINWGFGLVVSALTAVEVAKKLKKVNYGLLLACAYSGFLVWHAGISGSIPLKLTSPSSKIKDLLEVDSIDLSSTIFSSLNLIILSSVISTLFILAYFFSRSNDSQIVFNYEKKVHLAPQDNEGFSKKVENSKLIFGLISLMGSVYLLDHFIMGGKISLNIMIFIFLILAMLFSLNAKSFLNNFNSSVKASSGILLQFPFYAGIMGMMSSSGLATSISQYFLSISTESTFLFYTYLSAGLVNFFVPSGGGQWAIQAPIIIPAAKSLGISIPNAAMAIAWGDAWSNMVQPFWALPLLSISNLSLKHIMGYCVIIFLTVGFVTSFIFLIY